MRVVFLATGEIALPTLRELIRREDVELAALVTQPDRPVGRHQVLTAPAVKTEALAHHIPVLQPEKIVSAADALARLRADLFLVMAYGQYLPGKIISLPEKACWNLHASLLPRHRGASPVHHAILAGDVESGITVIEVAREMDAGAMVLHTRLTLDPGETAGTLHDRLARLAPEACHQALTLLHEGAAHPKEQNEDEVTYAPKLSRADGRLDWSAAADALEQRVRAFDPWPGTFTTLPDGKGLKIFPPVAVLPGELPGDGEACLPGTLHLPAAGRLAVTCGDGRLLEIERLQVEGGRRMSAADFLRGHPLDENARLGG